MGAPRRRVAVAPEPDLSRSTATPSTTSLCPSPETPSGPWRPSGRRSRPPSRRTGPASSRPVLFGSVFAVAVRDAAPPHALTSRPDRARAGIARRAAAAGPGGHPPPRPRPAGLPRPGAAPRPGGRGPQRGSGGRPGPGVGVGPGGHRSGRARHRRRPAGPGGPGRLRRPGRRGAGVGRGGGREARRRRWSSTAGAAPPAGTAGGRWSPSRPCWPAFPPSRLRPEFKRTADPRQPERPRPNAAPPGPAGGAPGGRPAGPDPGAGASGPGWPGPPSSWSPWPCCGPTTAARSPPPPPPEANSSVDTTPVDFGPAAEQGGVRITNSGREPLVFETRAGVPWLSFVGGEGTLDPGASVVVSAVLDRSRAPEGAADSEIRVQSNGGSAVVPVRAVVERAPEVSSVEVTPQTVVVRRCPGSTPAQVRAAVVEESGLGSVQLHWVRPGRAEQVSPMSGQATSSFGAPSARSTRPATCGGGSAPSTSATTAAPPRPRSCASAAARSSAIEIGEFQGLMARTYGARDRARGGTPPWPGWPRSWGSWPGRPARAAGRSSSTSWATSWPGWRRWPSSSACPSTRPPRATRTGCPRCWGHPSCAWLRNADCYSSVPVPPRPATPKDSAGSIAAGAVAEHRRGLPQRPQPLGEVLVGVAGVERQRLGLRRHRLDRAVAEHARPRRDELADDDVLLEAEQLVGAAFDGRLGQHPGGLLERRRRQPRVGGQRRLGDPHELGTAFGRLLARPPPGSGSSRRRPGCRPSRRAGTRSRPARRRPPAGASGGRSAPRACRGSTRPAPGRPAGPRRRGTPGSPGCP